MNLLRFAFQSKNDTHCLQIRCNQKLVFFPHELFFAMNKIILGAGTHWPAAPSWFKSFCCKLWTRVLVPSWAMLANLITEVWCLSLSQTRSWCELFGRPFWSAHWTLSWCVLVAENCMAQCCTEREGGAAGSSADAAAIPPPAPQGDDVIPEDGLSLPPLYRLGLLCISYLGRLEVLSQIKVFCVVSNLWFVCLTGWSWYWCTASVRPAHSVGGYQLEVRVYCTCKMSCNKLMAFNIPLVRCKCSIRNSLGIALWKFLQKLLSRWKGALCEVMSFH